MPERRGTSGMVKLLSVLLALILWIYVTEERTAERRLVVPLRVGNAPAGLSAEGVPAFVTVDVVGPRLTVALLHPEQLTIDLDLSGAAEGVVAVPGLDRRLALPDGLKVAMISPSRLEVRMERVGR